MGPQPQVVYLVDCHRYPIPGHGAEEVESDVADAGHVGSTMAPPEAGLVFLEFDIKHPVITVELR